MDIVQRLMVVIVVGVIAFLAIGYVANANTNDPGYWCEDGIKIEPVDTPFIVPDPPQGFTWSLLVIKAGSGPDENAEFPYPIVGEGYSHPSGHDNSHIILCREQDPSTTTSTTSSSTTTSLPTTTTTEGSTTTTVGTTTSSSTSTTTTDPTTTSLPTSTTSSTNPSESTTTSQPSQSTSSTSTVPTTTTTVPELPNTGIEVGWFALAAVVLTALGLGALAITAER